MVNKTAMIKVNLLRDQPSRSRKTLASHKKSRLGLLYAVIFLMAAGTMSLWNYCIHRQIEAALEKQELLRNRESNLQKLNREIEQYREKMHLQQSRINSIEQLIIRQADPVLLLNAVVQGIPRQGNIWLTSLTQKSGSVKIAGFTLQTEAIPELMNNLAGSRIFSSVDLEEIESREEASEFSLLCTDIKKTEVE